MCERGNSELGLHSYFSRQNQASCINTLLINVPFTNLWLLSPPEQHLGLSAVNTTMNSWKSRGTFLSSVFVNVSEPSISVLGFILTDEAQSHNYASTGQLPHSWNVTLILCILTCLTCELTSPFQMCILGKKKIIYTSVNMVLQLSLCPCTQCRSTCTKKKKKNLEKPTQHQILATTLLAKHSQTIASKCKVEKIQTTTKRSLHSQNQTRRRGGENKNTQHPAFFSLFLMLC